MDQPQPKVSVIMPVYNTAPYLEDALDSITGQTLREIEIIVINDGSTDGSLEIIERFAASDGRIKVISQANAGISVARNVGMEVARGEFTYFMDSDDLLGDDDALELCYAKCVRDDLDFVFFDAKPSSKSDYEVNYDYLRSGKIEDRTYGGTQVMQLLYDIRGFRAPVWLYFIRTGFLERIGLRFHPGIIHEDELFAAILHIEAQRVGAIDRTFFHRRLRQASVTTSRFSSKNVVGYLTVAGQLRAYYGTLKDNQAKRVLRTHIRRVLKSLMYNGEVMPFAGRIKLLCRILSGNAGYVSFVRCKRLIRGR